MENISGYARVLARTRVEQEQIKPFLRKPFLTLGQCFPMAGYFLQLGAILAAKYRKHLDAFGYSFLGLRGEPGAIEDWFSEAINDGLALLKEPMSFADYVMAEHIKLYKYPGDAAKFYAEHAMQKLDTASAEKMACQFAEQGAILGAMRPEVARRMFEHTHKPRDRADLDRARAAGLNIPDEQDVMSYAEVEKGENDAFLGYCQYCCPSLHSILTS